LRIDCPTNDFDLASSVQSFTDAAARAEANLLPTMNVAVPSNRAASYQALGIISSVTFEGDRPR